MQLEQETKRKQSDESITLCSHCCHTHQWGSDI